MFQPEDSREQTDKNVRSPLSAPFYDPNAETDKHRRNLPHWQQGEAWVFVTWRLGDALPQEKLEQWKAEREAWMKLHPEPWDEKTEDDYHERFSGQVDKWLDQGSGSCVLRDPANAKLVADALSHFDGERYELASFVVMPNHVHVLFRPLGEHALPDIVKSWKGFTAREINKQSGKTGALWQDEYWDRLIRNERHFLKVIEYIRKNPGERVFQPVYVSAMITDRIVRAPVGQESGSENPLPKTKGGKNVPPPLLARWNVLPPFMANEKTRSPLTIPGVWRQRSKRSAPFRRYSPS